MGLAFGQEIYQKSIIKIVQNQQIRFLKDFEVILKDFLRSNPIDFLRSNQKRTVVKQ